MASVSTFSVFTMARLGIYASQQGLSVTGNNVTNINTDGYTRQTLDQYSLHMAAADRYAAQGQLRMGAGVIAPSVSQTRDIYLDIRYRNENTNVGSATEKLDGLHQLGNILDEVNKGDDGEGVLEGMFNEAIDQLEALAAEGAGKDQYDGLFRGSMQTLVKQINTTAVNLAELQESKALQLQNDVDQVNDILKKIQELNVTIRKNAIYGDRSLEQKDQRNTLLDQLSSYMRIDVIYGTEEVSRGLNVEKLILRTGTDPQRTMMEGIYSTKLSIRNGSDEGDDPNYDLDFADLEDPHGNTIILRETDLGVVKNRDIGAVEDDDGEAINFPSQEAAQEEADRLNINAQGTEFQVKMEEDGSITVHEYGTTVYRTSEDAALALAEIEKDRSKYVDPFSGEVTRRDVRIIDNDGQYELHQFEVFRGEVQLHDTELSGSLQALRETLTEKGVFCSDEDLARDEQAAGKRGLPFYRKALDTLAYTLAETLNAANQLPDEMIYESIVTETVDENGNIVPGRDYIDADGHIVTGDKSRYVLKPEYKDYNGGVLLSNHGNSNDENSITAANISISRNWDNGSFRVLRSREANPPSTANDNLNHMINLMNGAHEFFTNNEGIYEKASSTEAFFTGSFQEMLTDHVMSTMGTDYRNTEVTLNNYTVSADQLYVNRDGVQGVDLNDEAMNMMKYQKSYSAACRLMTTFDSMLDKLINGMAV